MKVREPAALRIVLYPGHRLSRAAVHALATATSAFFAIRLGIGSQWLSSVAWGSAVAWYFAAFMGVHVVMIPVMTAWHAALRWFERRIREIVEEELILFDLRSFERQVERVFPGRSNFPDP